VRLSALMSAHVVYIFTHDSLWLGEDGPTHQPIEHVAALRAIPNLTVIRPADAREVSEAWKVAVECDGPVALILTRQNVDILDRNTFGPASALSKGAYVLAGAEGTPDVILLASGSEVHVALDARRVLAEKGIQARVVSMPSWELFEAQPQDYKDSVLPPEVTARLAVEAGVSMGWGRYVGLAGEVIGVDRFGESAPYKVLMEKFGFTGEAVAARAEKLLGR